MKLATNKRKKPEEIRDAVINGYDIDDETHVPGYQIGDIIFGNYIIKGFYPNFVLCESVPGKDNPNRFTHTTTFSYQDVYQKKTSSMYGVNKGNERKGRIIDVGDIDYDLARSSGLLED